MYTVNATPWIDYNLYNQFPDVQDARNLVEESYQQRKAKELMELIPEVARKIGIGIPHKHWFLRENENIIGRVEGSNLYSKPQYHTEIVCPTVWVPTKEGLRAVEGITNPSLEVSEVAKKVNELAGRISYLFPLEGENFSKFSVAIDPRTITDVENNCFLETNIDGVSVLNPISREKLELSNKDTILTYMAIDPDEKEITKVDCLSICLQLRDGHQNIHTPAPGGQSTFVSTV